VAHDKRAARTPTFSGKKPPNRLTITILAPGFEPRIDDLDANQLQ
jgi:hypothetical protein